MGKSPFFDHKMGLYKGPWTHEEDQKLLAHIQRHGHGSWGSLPSKAGLQRCGKSCRLRWTNYLRPDIKRGKFSLHEEQTIIQLHALLGNRWSTIANHLPKRTDNEIKNYWNTNLKKKLTKMGIDPMTHKPKNHTFTVCDGQPRDIAKLSHMAQWESARLEAEARLVRQSRLGISFSSYTFHNKNRDPCYTPAQPLILPPQPIPCLDVLKAWASINPRKSIPFDGFFDLQSQTSVFKFPEKLHQKNPSFESSNEGKVVDGKSDDQLIQDGIKGVTENSLMDHRLIHDEQHHVIAFSNNTIYVADDNLGFPSFMEGFNSNYHVRVSESTINAGFDQSGHSNKGCGGVSEENNSYYWGSSPMLLLEEM